MVLTALEGQYGGGGSAREWRPLCFSTCSSSIEGALQPVMSCLPLGKGREAGILYVGLELLTRVEQRAARNGSRRVRSTFWNRSGQASHVCA